MSIEQPLWSALLFALTVSIEGQTIDNGRRLSWRVSVRGGDSTDSPRTHRLYEVGDEFQLRLSVFNEFETPLLVDQQRLQRLLGLKLTSETGAEVDINVTWLPSVRFSGERFREPLSVDVAEPVRIDAQHGAGWTIGIRRADGERFDRRTYKIGVTMKTALSAFRDDAGAQWTGPPVLPETDLGVVMAPPGSTYERQREAYAAGRLAIEEGEFEAATNAYERALRIDPTDDAARSFLASTYISRRLYRDAIPLFQQLLERAAIGSRARTERSEALALAHLANGDESSAIRVLQAEGFSGPELAAQLADFRARVRNRP